MPGAIIPLLAGAIGGGIVGTVAATAIVAVGTYFVSDLLRGGPPKPDAAERSIKSPKPARVHVLGTRRVHGSSMLFLNTSDSETVDVWAFCEGPVNAVTRVYINDDRVTLSGGRVQALSDGSYGDNKVLAGFNLGAIPNVAHGPVVSRVSSWTTAHRGDGIVSGYLIKTGVKSDYFLDIYPQGDNVAMSLVVQGHRMHDPRRPTSDPYNPATWVYSDNSALLLLWFKTVFMGQDYDRKIAPVEQFWIDAANVCDELVPLSAGGSERRYRGWIMFPADADPKAVEDQILATFDGWTAEDAEGCIRVHAGKLYEPTGGITSDQIIDYEVQDFVEDENRINHFIVRYVSEAHDFNEPECEPWLDEDDILARGKEISSPLDLQVPSHTQARRLAKRVDARANAAKRGRVRVVYSARAALAQRFINLTIEEAGTVFFDGVVEVLGGEPDPQTGGATIEWVAVDPNVDAWNPATEDGYPAPTQEKYYLPPLTAPTVTSATAYIADDSISARIRMTVAGPNRSDITWYARWREAAGSAWNEAEFSDVDPGSSVQLVTGLVPANTSIQVAAAYKVGDGRTSPWSPSVTATATDETLEDLQAAIQDLLDRVEAIENAPPPPPPPPPDPEP